MQKQLHIKEKKIYICLLASQLIFFCLCHNAFSNYPCSEYIYNDDICDGWESYGSANLYATNSYEGEKSILVNLESNDIISFAVNQPLDTAKFSFIEFYIQSQTTFDLQVNLMGDKNYTFIFNTSHDEWKQIKVPIVDLNYLTSFVIKNTGEETCNFWLDEIKLLNTLDGDVNLDGKVDLNDVILSLQNCTDKNGINSIKGDVNNDLKIGIEETIFLLNYMANEKGYSYEEIIHSDVTEYALIFGSKHFMTIQTTNNQLIIKPHPASTIQGSSWYLQPYLSQQSNIVFGDIEILDQKIEILCSGRIYDKNSKYFGSWIFSMDFQYDPCKEEITGSGNLLINLNNQLNESSENLNLFRLTSNYLNNVPLLSPSGEIGDTGQMTKADLIGEEGYYPITWFPAELPSFISESNTGLESIFLYGQFNNVDAQALGNEEYLEPAQHPDIELTISPYQNIKLGVLCNYDQEKYQSIYEENVEIIPFIPFERSEKEFKFIIEFISR